MEQMHPEWLVVLRQDMASITEPAARQLWPNPDPSLPPFFNYRLEHVRQVERDAVALLAAVGGDQDIVLAGVWLHDRYQPALTGENHGQRAGDWARANLAALGFPVDKVERVAFTVAHHSDARGSIPADAHEARLLWDADKLAHTGPTEVINLLMNHVAADHLAGLAKNGSDRSHCMPSIAAMMQRFATANPPEGKFYFEATSRLAHERFDAAQRFCQVLGRQVCP